MIPDYLPDSLHGLLELLQPYLQPTATLLQLIAYGGLTLVAAVATIGSYLEDNQRNT